MNTHPLTVMTANKVFEAVYGTDETAKGTGNPSLNGRELNPKGQPLAKLAAGTVLSEVIWDSDKGNWMWDGAIATLKALGYDVEAPIV